MKKKTTKEKIMACIPPAIFLAIIGVVFLCVHIAEHPIEEKWAREYVKAHIAEGWVIEDIDDRYGTHAGFYGVSIDLIKMSSFTNGERFRSSGYIYFTKNGAIVRNELGDLWKKDYKNPENDYSSVFALGNV